MKYNLTDEEKNRVFKRMELFALWFLSSVLIAVAFGLGGFFKGLESGINISKDKEWLQVLNLEKMKIEKSLKEKYGL